MKILLVLSLLITAIFADSLVTVESSSSLDNKDHSEDAKDIDETTESKSGVKDIIVPTQREIRYLRSSEYDSYGSGKPYNNQKYNNVKKIEIYAPSRPKVKSPVRPYVTSVKAPSAPSRPYVEQPKQPQSPYLNQPEIPQAPILYSPKHPDYPQVITPNYPSSPYVQAPVQPQEVYVQSPYSPSQPIVEYPNRPERPYPYKPVAPQPPSVQYPSEPNNPYIEQPYAPQRPNVYSPERPVSPYVETPEMPYTVNFYSYPYGDDYEDPLYRMVPFPDIVGQALQAADFNEEIKQKTLAHDKVQDAVRDLIDATFEAIHETRTKNDNHSSEKIQTEVESPTAETNETTSKDSEDSA